ncbi:trihelix transcription factor GT-3b-like isoform X2 [Benincasa hispida]|uniref:trihelix transcription factor GT-3b-like isoform X1 n=1 Tax=Benincasa hispida TaxID=102211 RepID=UPI00190219CD|nr:trihelix transcription factor GT-3b-like isoform X1 [Benincasa hispida]XP_038903385.1 trihelix transcription factor GT-3b-like isoform X2 [Benincasa hispida]
MEGHHPHPHPLIQLHQQQLIQHPPPPHLHQSLTVSADQTTGSAADRFPQWSIQETKEFLMIRAELDQTFMETKRNKLLWEITASKMKEKGFNRSAEQCKCKWKNLVTRYKGCETMEPEISRQQFPFFTELQAIFGARMQRILWAEAESGGSGSKKKTTMALSSDDDEENDDSDGDGGETKVSGRKRKRIKGTSSTTTIGGEGSGKSSINDLKEILEDFMNQQMQMEVQWREAFEAREKERQMKEMEWRRNMEALEHERIMLERRWREREEQRRMREEVRAEKRDALITALLNKLRRDDHI